MLKRLFLLLLLSVVFIADGRADTPRKAADAAAQKLGAANLQPSRVAEYFNLSGRKVTAPLAPGFYIRRQGHQTTKILVR